MGELGDCRKLLLLCELELRFSTINKERCSGMKSSNEGVECECLETATVGNGEQDSTMIGFWTCRV